MSPPAPTTAPARPRRRAGVIPRLGILAAVVGPGLLAGLSDDDPAGITTYSILGARHGYALLWVIAVSTFALIVFHEVAARSGVVTGKGLAALTRDRYGRHATAAVLAALLVANLGTTCAEFAGLAAGAGLAGIPRGAVVPAAVVAIAALLFRGSFKRVEHVLIALGAVFITYVAAALLSHPDWGAAARGTVVPTLPAGRDAMLVVVAAVGTTLAPWGLTFLQSYAVDKHLVTAQLRAERADVVVGAVLTGIIGGFVAIACAATLHPRGIRIDDARQAAEALRPAAGSAATALFGVGLVGAALLAAAVLPLATAYSVCEAVGRPAHVDAGPREEPLFYGTIAGTLALAGALVLIPGAPLIPILFLTQALNAILLVPLLWLLRHFAKDRELMGHEALARGDRWLTGLILGAITVSVVALGVLSVF